MNGPVIHNATSADAVAIAAIYDHHARNGTATFDLTGPSTEEWAAKIDTVQANGWPFLTIIVDRDVAGYAYATQFRDRPAYAATCENSIYLHPDRLGRGLGRMLLQALMQAALESGFEQMIAVVGGGEPSSVALHLRCGFVERGRMLGVGRKFDRILDTVYLQADLRDTILSASA